MTALALINTHRQRGHPAAMPYYAMCPIEPVLPGQATMRISRRVGTPTMTLDWILDEILRHRSFREVLIVSHGNIGQTNIPLTSDRGAVGLSDRSLSVLEGNAYGRLSDADTAQMLGISPHSFDRIRDKQGHVNNLQLTRLEIRACLVGRLNPTTSRSTSFGWHSPSRDMLYLLKDFFGAGSACGPTRIDFFSEVHVGRPTLHPADWQRWQSNWPYHHMLFEPPNRLAWHVDAFYPYNFHIMSDSRLAVENFMRRVLPCDNLSYRQRIPVHALMTVTPRDLIFAGESDFRDSLRRVT